MREVECDLADGPGSPGVVREQYDPARHTLAEREQSKAEELTALRVGRVSRTTVQRVRLACGKQWGLLDHRTTRASSPTGRSDERVVAAVREALRRRRGRSKGTINGLFPLINQILEDWHGPGAVAGAAWSLLEGARTAHARFAQGQGRFAPSVYRARSLPGSVSTCRTGAGWRTKYFPHVKGSRGCGAR